jgi:hypothetical protein
MLRPSCASELTAGCTHARFHLRANKKTRTKLSLTVPFVRELGHTRPICGSYNAPADVKSAPAFLCPPARSSTVQKSVLLRALQQETRRHDFDTFVDEPPSVAQGGKGVVVPGSRCCRARFGTIAQFIDHLTNDVLPETIMSCRWTKHKGRSPGEYGQIDFPPLKMLETIVPPKQVRK